MDATLSGRFESYTMAVFRRGEEARVAYIAGCEAGVIHLTNETTKQTLVGPVLGPRRKNVKLAGRRSPARLRSLL